jgi:hypothetical protein
LPVGAAGESFGVGAGFSFSVQADPSHQRRKPSFSGDGYQPSTGEFAKTTPNR